MHILLRNTHTLLYVTVNAFIFTIFGQIIFLCDANNVCNTPQNLRHDCKLISIFITNIFEQMIILNESLSYFAAMANYIQYITLQKCATCLFIIIKLNILLWIHVIVRNVRMLKRHAGIYFSISKQINFSFVIMLNFLQMYINFFLKVSLFLLGLYVRKLGLQN
ncbi:hypothetical protein QTP88_015087 [Uroleucon formosanum]